MEVRADLIRVEICVCKGVCVCVCVCVCMCVCVRECVKCLCPFSWEKEPGDPMKVLADFMRVEIRVCVCMYVCLCVWVFVCV